MDTPCVHQAGGTTTFRRRAPAVPVPPRHHLLGRSSPRHAGPAGGVKLSTATRALCGCVAVASIMVQLLRMYSSTRCAVALHRCHFTWPCPVRGGGGAGERHPGGGEIPPRHTRHAPRARGGTDGAARQRDSGAPPSEGAHQRTRGAGGGDDRHRKGYVAAARRKGSTLEASRNGGGGRRRRWVPGGGVGLSSW